jgi:predicted permease
VRQLLTEGVIIAITSAGVALWVAALVGPVLGRTLLNGETGQFIEPSLLALTAGIALGSGILIGLAPAAQSLLSGLNPTSRSNAATLTPRASRLRVALLVAQSALCMGMIVLAALFSLSLRRVTSLEMPLDVRHTVRALVNLDDLLISNEVVESTYEEMLRRVRSIPGVVNVALAGTDPYLGGRAVSPHTAQHDASYYWQPNGAQVAMEAPVGAGFFTTVGAPLRGRDFSPSDARNAPLVAIINSPLARILYGADEALGQCIVLPKRTDERSGACATVVGVLPGVWYSSKLNREKPMVYVPLSQRSANYGFFRPRGVFVRTAGDPALVSESIRRALQSVRSDLPAVRMTLMRDLVAAETKPWRLGATLFGLFGAVALVVAMIGMYGVVSYSATQRSFEIAVRLALGARRGDIMVVVAGSAIAAVATGLTIGTTGALAVRRWVGPLLFQTAPDDPGIFLGTAALLLGVAILAILRPTNRAVRLDPAAILRAG